jgi:copper transport protein
VRWGRLATGLGIVALATTIVASPAQAHAELIDSTPAADSVLEESPAAIVLTFSESVDIVDDSIRLVDPAGEAVDVGPVRRDGGSRTVAVDIDAELSGSYVVGWHVVSADAHPISGAFTFAVGQVTSTDPTLVEDVLAQSGDTGGSNGWMGVGRWLSYSGIAVLVGGFAILAACAPTLLATQRARLLLGLGADAAAIGTLVMLGAQAAVLGDGALDPDGWIAVMESRAGRWWFVRLLLLVVAPLVLAAARRVLDRRPFVIGAGVYGLVLLCVVAAGGHAVTGRDVAVGFFATLIHLAAMAIWVGGIVAIVVVVGRRELWSAASRFSPIALGSVVALAITGSINAWRQLDGIASITDSSYGRWLMVKLVLVAVVVAAAVVSRWQLRQYTVAAPVLAASTVGAAASPDGMTAADAPPHDARGLRRSVIVELVGMAVVLVATVGLVDSPPPRATAEQAPEPVTVTATQGNWEAQIDLLPAQTGGTTMHVFLLATDGSQDVADEITVTATLPAQDLGPIEIPTTPIPPNHVTTDDADFPVAGMWEITVTARFGEFDQVVLTTTVEIR